MLSDVCLSVAYIGPKSRTERPRKTKIGTGIAHITPDSDTTFNVLSVGTYCYVAVCRRGRLDGARRGAYRGRRGAGAHCGGHPHSLFVVVVVAAGEKYQSPAHPMTESAM